MRALLDWWRSRCGDGAGGGVSREAYEASEHLPGLACASEAFILLDTER